MQINNFQIATMQKTYPDLKISLVLAVLFLLSLTNCKKENNISYGSVTDLDGITYKTIVIGTQTWMAENLRSTKYQNGDSIPMVTNAISWGNLTTGAYCNFNNTSYSDSIAAFGRLYNWIAVMDSRNIAPAGWHVPTDAEWEILANFLGGDSLAGGKLKEAGLKHWVSPNMGANNSSGFTAIPSGFNDPYGSFWNIGLGSFCWSASASPIGAWHRSLSYDNRILRRGESYTHSGYSVRCLKN